MAEETQRQDSVGGRVVAGIFEGAKQGFRSFIGTLADTADENAVRIPGVAEAIQEESTLRTAELVQGVTAQMRNEWEPVTTEVADGINPENKSLWSTISKAVIGESKGFSKVFKFFGASALWIGASVGSIFATAWARSKNLIDTTNNENWLQNGSNNFRKFISGIFWIFGDTEAKPNWKKVEDATARLVPNAPVTA